METGQLARGGYFILSKGFMAIYAQKLLREFTKGKPTWQHRIVRSSITEEIQNSTKQFGFFTGNNKENPRLGGWK